MITREQYDRIQRCDSSGLQLVQRVDRYALRIDASSVVAHANGWVDVWGVATRVGVFEYDDASRPGAVIREYRPPDEVLRAESLATLVGVPFTIDHPANPVTSATFRDLAHGHVLEIKVDGDLVLARIRVASDEAKAAIRSGTIELSCGYSARLDETAGVTPDGLPYDATQRDIRYNHLALVELARAGHVARLHFDARGGRVQRLDQASKRTGPTMYTLTLNGKTHTIPAVLVPGIAKAGEDAAKAVRRGDAIETASVSFDTPEGKIELVLPAGTVQEMLAMIGAVEGAAEPPVEPPADAIEPDPLEDPDPLEQPADELGESPAAKPGRMDKAIRAMVAKAVAEAVKASVPKALQAREDRARERSELERQCSPHLDAGYRFDKAGDLDIVLDTIEALDPDRSDAAKSLVVAARKGSDRARGRLDAMLEHLLETSGDERNDTGRQLGAVFALRQATADAAQTMSDGPKVTRHERARQDRIAKLAVRSSATRDQAAG